MESMKLDIQMFAEGTATYFNGVELTDIYYNNSKLLEMYYNGTLVFKKPTIYKRRIMVDDNLKDKTIFINPVTDNVYQFLRDYIDNNPDTFYLSIITVENEALDPSYQKGGYCAILTYDTTGIEVNYEFYNGLLHPVNFLGGDNENNMIVNTNVEIPFNDNLSVVSDINDVNPVYRWLYIEDSNIRPLQVGDKIINGTKLYFIFPDNLYKTFLEAAPEVGPGVHNFINAIYDDGFFIGFRDFTLNNNRSITIIVGDDSRRINAYGIDINFPDDMDNISSYTVDLSNTESTGIVYIDPNPYAYMGYENLNLNEYILVDTRTLGKVYYRRIIVGDNLRRQTIYADFPAEYYSTFSLNTNSSVSLIKSNELSLINETVLIGSSYTSNAYVSILSPYNDSEISMPDLYNYQNGNETIYNSITMDYSQNFVVTDIVNNASYRHLYLKDLNIRPLQVGDILTNNTVLYFNFPDDLGIQAINSYNQEKFTEDVVYCSNNFRIYGEVNGSKYKICVSVDENSSTIYSSNLGNIEINSSFMSLELSGSFMSTGINSTNANSILYDNDYILVDTTTLSTGGGHGH